MSRSAIQLSLISTINKYTLEPFSECVSVNNVMYVRRKTVPGSWAGVTETMLYEFDCGSWQHVLRLNLH